MKYTTLTTLKQNNPRWKGSNAGYQSKHQFLVRNFGNPKICEICHKTGHKEAGGRWNIHYAKKHESLYTHERDDYFGLCRTCHGKYDLTDEKRDKLKKAASGKKGKSNIKRIIALSRKRDIHGHFIKTTT